MSARISVARVDDGDPLGFDVSVRDEKSETRHRVSLARKDLARLGGDAEELVEASFRFLLDREPKESILSRFDVSVIARYFPEYERALAGYLTKG